MACLDSELCDKIDTLIQLQIDNQTANETLVADFHDSVIQEFPLIESGFSLILGFLAWFLFFLIIKFFFYIFEKIF